LADKIDKDEVGYVAAKYGDYILQDLDMITLEGTKWLDGQVHKSFGKEKNRF